MSPTVPRPPRPLWTAGGLLLAVAAATGAAAPAVAGTVSTSGNDVVFAAGAGERNQLRAGTSQPGGILSRPNWAGYLSDDGAPLATGPGCRPADVVGTICDVGGPTGFRIDVGDGDDDVKLYDEGDSPATAVVRGGPGNDALGGLDARIDLDGGPGDDILSPDYVTSTGGPPSPAPGGVVRGGPGTDTVDYQQVGARGGLTVTLDDQPNDGTAGEGDNVHADVENVVGSAYNDNRLTGSATANRLEGAGGDDRLTGGGGRDVLRGWGGSDTLDALDGSGGDRVECGDGADVAQADAGDVLSKDCEKVVLAPALRSTRLRYRGKRVAIALSCPRTSRGTCAGSVRLTTADGRALARAGYRLRRGARATVTVKPRRQPARRATLVIAPKGTAPVAGRAVTVR
ncbi:calcium-binding protein [Patulibacter defluvii]|uniref:calcium-binding protein n=1 Tax=Patulibacter defluvii TaxID=3095358 RepID=UPI002A7633CD|nr:hypothetical protein [Patulibacter sp. DM4]